MRPASQPGNTFDTRRSVLFVGRTTQSSVRLLYDVMPLLVEDERIQCFYTVDPTTMFSDRVPALLADHQVKLVPWNDAVSGRFDCDVTVTASAHESLPQLPGKKFVMGHGAGHHKYRATVAGFETIEAGLSPNQLLHNGEVHPSVIAMAGSEQIDRLRLRTPQAVERAVVTGDVCAERLHVSTPHRDRYRHRFGLRPGQRLIAVTSTWGPHSLIARRRPLALRLLSELPANRYKVALILHPNCWDWHGEPNITGLLRTARNAGLIQIQPHEGWRATVVAADCVIGDHGSVGFFAADLGRPLLYAAHGDREVPAGSPGAELARLVPRLEVDDDLEDKIESTIATHHPDRYRAITESVLDPTVSASAKTRELLYELLELEPTGPAPKPEPFPQPEIKAAEPTSWYIHPQPTLGDRLRLVRYPVTSITQGSDHDIRERVLVVDAAEAHRQHHLAASVLTWTESPLCIEDAVEWCTTTMEAHPGSGVAVARLPDGGALVRTRGPRFMEASTTGQLQHAELGTAVYLQTGPAFPSRLCLYDGQRPMDVMLNPVG